MANVGVFLLKMTIKISMIIEEVVMKYLSVSEFANMFNVSRQTLIYYDKIDLFKPCEVDPKTGYRKYTYNQFSQFSFIKFLRSLGFSIEKIKDLLSHDNLNTLKEELNFQADMILKEQERLSEIIQTIDRKLDFVDEKLKISKNIDYDFISSPPRIYYSLGYEENIYNSSLFFNYPTLVFYNYKKEIRSYDKVFGALVGFNYVKEEYEDFIKYLDKYKALRFFYEGPYADIPRVVEEVKKKFPDKNFSKDFICINILDPFLENMVDRYLTEIHIPICS